MNTLLANVSDGYIAGLFDGEGCMTIKVSGGQFTPIASITMRERQILAEIARVYGGAVYAKSSRPGAAPCYEWQVWGHDLLAFLLTITKLLVAKREQARVLLAYYATGIGIHTSRNHPVPAEVVGRRLALVAKIRDLNRLGVPKELSA